MGNSTTPQDSAAMSPASTGSLANAHSALQDAEAKIIADGIAKIMQIASEPDWIPATERLPPDNVDVLVRRKTVCGMRSVVAYRCEGNDCWTLNDGDYEDFYDHSVTHWMPLPAPPTDAK